MRTAALLHHTTTPRCWLCSCTTRHGVLYSFYTKTADSVMNLTRPCSYLLSIYSYVYSVLSAYLPCFCSLLKSIIYSSIKTAAEIIYLTKGTEMRRVWRNSVAFSPTLRCVIHHWSTSAGALEISAAFLATTTHAEKRYETRFLFVFLRICRRSASGLTNCEVE